MYSDVFVESEKLGSLIDSKFGLDWWVSNQSGISARRPQSNPSTVTYKRAIAAGTRRIKNSPPYCRSEVILSASAGYPFIPASPNIDYILRLSFEGIERDKVRISWEFEHNQFPDFELVIDGSTTAPGSIQAYSYISPKEGPGVFNLNLDAPLGRGSKTITAKVPCGCRLVK